MASIVAYCRAGFEADAASELDAACAGLELFGYSQFVPGQGYVAFELYDAQTLQHASQSIRLDALVFVRQLIFCPYHFTALPKRDRIGALELDTFVLPKAGVLRVEHPESDDGKELSTFCRKFTVPLRLAMRQHDLLSKKENPALATIHVFFTDGESAFVGFSHPNNASPFPLGIMRLKFPADAPSRSTLKLDEAIQSLLSEKERQRWFKAGNSAVDLGACPGGWTYQLVRRNMRVEAVDNGAMDDALMETGLVSYYAEDGFKYRPQKGRVDVLVCDMIERPDRVAKLMSQWVIEQWCNVAVFNLKLPMKKRAAAIDEIKTQIVQQFSDAGRTATLRIKHLYHDRDEVTAVLFS
ncbi:23S rRNA (cytidine(2498)-2'-O)-methyltransferase RlmM [Aestuariibacter salexigens]|uniref:23S rRNA (cytidine(2498)-2'-O)-methyltransferase RlmM n=1 Tax=Aestuariibacter salexigens TaxID=226010 RepID=UPI000407572D|nr:23S rRNA (cytidine(2498)-2'-O)-methyltransferase RlmM [Aestuariibacter salexigens]